MVELLLEAGAAPNAMDAGRNSPLHLAVFSQPRLPETRSYDWWEMIDVLLKHDADVDVANAEGQRPCSLLPPGVVFDNTTLTCLSANIVRKYKLPYRGIVPTTVADFVDRH